MAARRYCTPTAEVGNLILGPAKPEERVEQPCQFGRQVVKLLSVGWGTRRTNVYCPNDHQVLTFPITKHEMIGLNAQKGGVCRADQVATQGDGM
jgi:hypothetical protein